MEDEYLSCAQKRFGLDYLFPYQRLVIAGLVESLRATNTETARDDAIVLGNQIVVLPTGAGKSLCFLLPAALCGGVTLVIYPLLGLMNDQERRMNDAGFSVRQLRGGQEPQVRRGIAAEVAAGSLDFLVTNPETLATDSVQTMLSAHPPVHVVVDEAHCISEWGDTFRPAYTTLGDSLDGIGAPRRTAFTATASDRVIARIREVLFSRTGASVIRGNPDRPNISYSVVPTLSVHHAVQSMVTIEPTSGIAPSGTANILPVWHPGDYLQRPSLIFCRTRRETEAIARSLRPFLPPGAAMYYHAGLSRERKTSIEQEFFQRSDAVLAATCAYGMGVDKSDIRTVVHTYLPETAEAFLQESGRAGRDRAPAQSIVLLTPEEQIGYQGARCVTSHTPVQNMAFGTSCRRTALLQHFGIVDETCSGCDRCDPLHTAPPWSLAAALILETIRHDPVRRAARVWTRVLTGRLSHGDQLRGLTRHAATGSLAEWKPHDVADALTQLTELGLLRRHRTYLVIAREGVADSRGLLLPFRTPQRAPGLSPHRRPRRWRDSRGERC